METATEKSINEQVRDLRRQCLVVIADTRVKLEQHRHSLTEEGTERYFRDSIEYEPTFLKHMIALPCRKSHKVRRYKEILHELEYRRDYMMVACIAGTTPKFDCGSLPDYEDSVRGNLHREVDNGYLVQHGDGSYFLTAKGEVVLSRELRYYLSGVSGRFEPDIKILEGLSDDSTEADYQENHAAICGRKWLELPSYWERIRSTLLATLPTDVLYQIEARKRKPCKVKVAVPDWIAALVPVMLKDVEMLDRGFNIATGEESCCRRNP